MVGMLCMVLFFGLVLIFRHFCVNFEILLRGVIADENSLRNAYTCETSGWKINYLKIMSLKPLNQKPMKLRFMNFETTDPWTTIIKFTNRPTWSSKCKFTDSRFCGLVGLGFMSFLRIHIHYGFFCLCFMRPSISGLEFLVFHFVGFGVVSLRLQYLGIWRFLCIYMLDCSPWVHNV